MSECNDMELIEKIGLGESELFGEIVRRYQNRVFRFVRSNGRIIRRVP